MEITEDNLKKCFSEVKKIAKEKSRIDLMFDQWCSEYFGIDDFSLIYKNHDENCIYNIREDLKKTLSKALKIIDEN